MTELANFDDLIERLGQLGDALDVDGTDLAGGVIDRITATSAPSPSHTRPWLVAAAAVILGVVGVVAYPDSRHALAHWFGLRGLDVQIDPDLSIPSRPVPFDSPGPGETTVVEVDGQQIIVSAVSGALNEILMMKTVASSDQISEVTVNGQPGLWLSGQPHEVIYESANGEVVVERVAANTLIWQDGDVLLRIEGFAELSDALQFAEGT